jgi:hypothetical protein
MTIKLSGPTINHYIIQSRIFAIILGCIAIFWGLETFPIFWQQALMERTASRIIRGDQYKIETLLRQMPVVEAAEKSTRCDPRALWSGAIIRLRIAEQNAFDVQQIKSLDNSIRTSLSCSPSDPFLWLALYWEAVTKKSFQQDYQNYLRMSYRLGPNEGWVALKRNTIVFINMDGLPNDLVDDGFSEFIRLLKSRNFFTEAASILVGPAWRVRDQVLSRLSELSERDREDFAQVLQSKGYDLPIPGIQLQKHLNH